MKRVIRLPNGKQVGIGAYARAWKKLAAGKYADDDVFRDWDYFPVTADVVLLKMRDGMHDRINRHLPAYGRGRKWSSDWQREVEHTARLVNTPRLVVRWVPRDLRARLSHRIERNA